MRKLFIFSITLFIGLSFVSGKAIIEDNQNGYIRVDGSNLSNKLNYEMTFSYWIKLNEDQPGEFSVLARRSGENTYNYPYRGYSWGIYHAYGDGSGVNDDYDRIDFYLQPGDGEYTSYNPAVVGTPVKVGETYHVVAKYNGTDIFLYINGKLNATKHLWDKPRPIADFNWLTYGKDGLNYRSDSNNFEIWECRLYNRSLNDSEIERLYYGEDIEDGLNFISINEW